MIDCLCIACVFFFLFCFVVVLSSPFLSLLPKLSPPMIFLTSVLPILSLVLLQGTGSSRVVLGC